MARRADRALLGALVVSALGHVAVIAGPAWQLPEDNGDSRTRVEARIVAAPAAPARTGLQAAAALAPTVEPAPKPASKPRPRLRRKPVPPATPQTPVASLGDLPAAEPQVAEAATAPVEAPAAEPAARIPDSESGGENTPAEPAGAAPTGGEVTDPAEEIGSRAAPAGALQEAGAPAEAALPRAARIAFSLILANLQVGEALQTWQRDERGYRLRIVMETTGAARLFKALTITQTSAGELDAGGLKPQSFVYEQTGRNTANSTFDWAQMKLILEQGENRKEFPLDPGAQDLLSLPYQLGLAQEARQTTVSVASGKNYNRHKLEWVGEETVATPAGEVRAMHVRTVGGDQTTEFWLAPRLHNLPVRIMFTDRKGTATQLIAHDVEADGTALLRRTDVTERK